MSTQEGENALDAHEYLLQVTKLDKQINNKIIELDQLRSMTSSKGIRYDLDKVQSSGDLEGFAKYIPKIVSMEQEINDMIGQLVDKKKEIVGILEQVTDPVCYDILHMRFIQQMKWAEVSTKTGMSIQYIHVLKNKGLNEVQKILDKSL